MPLWPPLDETAESVRDALASLRGTLSLAVVAAGNPFAVGAIIRVCHSFLVKEILLLGTEPYYEKASMGMHRFERVVRLPDESAFFAYTAGRPLWGLEREPSRRSLYEVTSFPENLVLCAGSERFGLPPSILDRCEEVLAIPLYGVNNSLPVTVAVGIALSHWARVRYQPGTTLAGPPRR